MKQSIFLLLACVYVLIGCREKLENYEFRQEDQFCINGILNNADSINYIYCSHLSGSKLEKVEDAEILFYVNDNLVEVIHQGKYKGEYPVLSHYKAGDVVRIEVSSAQFNASAWAEMLAPYPLHVLNVDTFTTQYVERDILQDALQIQLQLQKTGQGQQYYRANAGFGSENTYGVAKFEYDTIVHGLMNRLYEFDSVEVQYEPSFIIDKDIALTEGKGFMQNPSDDALSFTPIFTNKYNLFSSSYFDGNQYQLSFLTHLGNPKLIFWSFHWWTPDYVTPWITGHKFQRVSMPDEEGIYRGDYALYRKYARPYYYYQLYSMSEEEYRYLKGVNNRTDIEDQEPSFYDAIPLPQNIHGALGFFAVETCTTEKIYLPSIEL